MNELNWVGGQEANPFHATGLFLYPFLSSSSIEAGRVMD